MWVYEEVLADGSKLSEYINVHHENPKYLKGFQLPHNVVAVPELLDAVAGATHLVFVVPHQFVDGLCRQLAGHILPSARAISLIKGLDCNRGLETISNRIESALHIDVSVLMGANLANDIAKELFSEATIGYHVASNGALWKDIFQTHYFHICLIDDVMGVELCGALKNIVAFAAGIVDGMYGSGRADNTKAAVMRRGLIETRALSRLVDPEVKDETFFESCGIADLITSSYGGRNRKVGEALVSSGKSLDELETELLGGQKLQGPATAKEVYHFIESRGIHADFPLFVSVYRICYEGRDARLLLTDLSESQAKPTRTV